MDADRGVGGALDSRKCDILWVVHARPGISIEECVMPLMSLAMMIDYEFCSGCCECELACIISHGGDPDAVGIRVMKLGPWRRPDGFIQLDFLPVVSDWCDLCKGQQSESFTTECARRCPNNCINCGTIEELTHYSELKPKTILYSI